MTCTRFFLPMLALVLCSAAIAADGPATSLSIDANAVPAPAAAEPPYVGEPIELTAAQRLERALRSVQVGLDRTRSDRTQDQEKIVCVKQNAIGSHRSVIQCATNRHWRAIRESTVATFTGTGGGGANKSDQLFTMSTDDYYKLEKRFGKLPEDMRDLTGKW